MSTKELSRLEIMQRLAEKRMSQREAAHVLGVSVRQVKRLLRAYREHGAQGLISKRRGRPSNNRLAEDRCVGGVGRLRQGVRRPAGGSPAGGRPRRSDGEAGSGGAADG